MREKSDFERYLLLWWLQLSWLKDDPRAKIKCVDGWTHARTVKVYYCDSFTITNNYLVQS